MALDFTNFKTLIKKFIFLDNKFLPKIGLIVVFYDWFLKQGSSKN